MREIKRGSRRTGAREQRRVIYAEYISSFAWYKRREKWSKAEKIRQNRSDLFCYGGCTKKWVFGQKTSHMHHYTYVRLTKEAHADLWSLCESCHYWLHDLIEQKSWARLNREQANKYGLMMIREQNMKPQKRENNLLVNGSDGEGQRND